MIQLKNRNEWINEKLIISAYDFNGDKCKIQMMNGDAYYSDESAQEFCERINAKRRSEQMINEQIRNRVAKEYGR